MGAPSGKLIGIPSPVLQSIIDAGTACLIANTVRGSSYSIAGRSFQFPTLEAAQDMLAEANYALALATGARSMNVRANFNPAIGRGVPQGNRQTT
jgi:hypothetical protein